MNPRGVPAIVVTGFPDPMREAQARQFGAQFLLEPIEPAGLLTLVAELLQNVREATVEVWLERARGRLVATEKKARR